MPAANNVEGRIWLGPKVDNLNDLMAPWKSAGHYFLHKLATDMANLVLFTDFESGRNWTGAQLRDKIMSVSCALVDKYNFKPETMVCISYDNTDHLLILALAIICAGGTVACSFPKDPYAELLYLARKVEPRLLFCHAKNVTWSEQLSKDLGQQVRGISMDGEDFDLLLNYDYSKSASCEKIPIACDDLKSQVALISMSSGTSGKPKAVAQTHWNVLADLFMAPRRSGKGICFACCASLDYVSGRIIMFGSIHLGYHTILLNGFEPATYLTACERYKVSVIYIGAAAFYNIITYEQLDRYDLSSIKCVFPMGAKIIYLEELRKFFAKYPHIVQVRQGYGASEFSGGAMNSMTPEEYLRDCDNCGRLLPGMRAKIVNPTSGQLMGPNEKGILHMRGATVFPGYFDMEHARQSASACKLDVDQNLNSQLVSWSPFVRDEQIFDSDGYYISGDWAYFNQHEELYIEGRQKEMMSCRGAKKVLPAELEQVIDKHPAVAKVCVLGVANKSQLTLHCPRAFIVPQAEYYHTTTTNTSDQMSTRLLTLNSELNRDLAEEKLQFQGQSVLCKLEPDERRRAILVDVMKFVNERVGWEKHLTGGLALLDDIPTSRATGKFDKNYLRSLTSKQVELYGDRSSTQT